MPYEDARMRAARLFREAVTRDPSLYKEFAPKFQTVGLDIGMGAPKGWTLPAMPDTSPGPFGDRNMPRPRPDMPPGFTAADDPYLARQNMPPPASGLAPDAPFMANPAVAAGAMQPASSLYPGFTQRDPAVGSSFSGLTRRRLDYGQGGPAVPGGIPSGGLQQPYGGAGPATPGAMPRQAPPLGGSPFTGSPGMASRLGDNSQLASGAFTGGQPPYGGAGPATPGGTGGLSPPYGGAGPAVPGGMPPASRLLAGQPFTGPPGMASRIGDQSQLGGDAFSRPPSVGPPPPIQPSSVISQGGFKPAPGFDQPLRPASPPTSLPPLSPQMAGLARGIPNPADALQALPPSPASLAPTSTASNPLQRAPLNLAAGIGATAQPVGSTSMPFAAIPPTPASVAQRTGDYLGPLPSSAGTGAPVRSVQTPLIAAPPASGTVPPVGPVPSQDLPTPPPVGVPPMLASVGPPNPARMEVVANYNPQTGQRTSGPPRGKGARQAIEAAAPSSVVPAQQQQTPAWRNAKNLGTYAGATAGLFAGGLGGAAAGAGAGRLLGMVVSAIRNRGQTVDAQGNILNKAGEIVGHVSDMLGKAGGGLGGIFGSGGGGMSSGGMGMGGWSGSGGWGGGSSYTGGNYGGNAGANINAGIGQRFGQR